ncbi:hypothetical protein ACKKBF_B34490 [Auxenochlorella protothecoides x Auxenochlorella symbiontica]
MSMLSLGVRGLRCQAPKRTVVAMASPRLRAMPAREVKNLLQSEAGAGVVVLDVRDYDFEGGHIRGCINRPAASFDKDADVDKFIDTELGPGVKTVVVHCALSQVRGPYTAQRLLSRIQKRSAAGSQSPEVVVMSRGWLGAAQIMAEDEDLTCTCQDASCYRQHAVQMLGGEDDTNIL